jgi:hypothetical protein
VGDQLGLGLGPLTFLRVQADGYDLDILAREVLVELVKAGKGALAVPAPRGVEDRDLDLVRLAPELLVFVAVTSGAGLPKSSCAGRVCCRGAAGLAAWACATLSCCNALSTARMSERIALISVFSASSSARTSPSLAVAGAVS